MGGVRSKRVCKLEGLYVLWHPSFVAINTVSICYTSLYIEDYKCKACGKSALK